MATEQELRELLEKKLGLTRYHSSAFISLSLENRHLSAKEVCAATGIPLGRIYSVLSGLEQDGLVRRIPGKTQHFAAVPAARAAEKLLAARGQELRQKEKELGQAGKSLAKQIAALQKRPAAEVTVNYYTSGEDYWPVYAEAHSSMRPTDTLRAIITIRPLFSFLKKEVQSDKPLKQTISHIGLDQGLSMPHLYLTNLDTLVCLAYSEFKQDKAKTLASLAKLLMYLEMYKGKFVYKSMDIAKNMTIFIMRDRVFMEFYADSSTGLVSALEIRNERIREDFKSWFDSIFGDTRDKAAHFEAFKQELIHKADEIAGIEPAAFHKFLATNDFWKL